jgi:ribose/xylose/arabinose/galactoside ABC-type transport system permease subunit
MNLKKILRSPALGNSLPIIGLTLLLLFLAVLRSPDFLSVSNMLNLARRAAPLGIVCIGQTLVILSAGVDLSVGTMAILTNVVAADIMQGKDANNPAAFAAVLGVAALVGFVNGAAVAWSRISSFVMTLAMGIVIFGAALVYSNGIAGGSASPLVKYLAVGQLAGLPVAVLIWLALSALTLFLLHFTTYGRRLYAAGSNPRTARLSGVHVPSTLILAYILSAVSAMFAGLIVTGNVGVGTLEWGFDYKLISMAAVIMGGTAFAGGQGGYLGSFFAALALIVLDSLLTIVRVPEAVRQMIYGAVILFSLWVSTRRK